MRIHQLIEGLNITLARGSADRSVSDVVDDSRQATPGSLVIARTGPKTDGAQHARQAVERGAVAVYCDRPLELPEGVTLLTGKDAIGDASGMIDRFFGEPAKKLTLIGVT